MKKILIANRGEIAVRVIRACQELGIKTVAVYSLGDRESLHTKIADESICIGEAPSSLSYLNIPSIMSAAEVTGVDGIHPGYGFLSESAQFASVCEKYGIKFIGPSSENIRTLGDKISARAAAIKAGVPLLPGTENSIESIEEAIEATKKIGFPLIIKAAAGGGGRGMKIVENVDELEVKFHIAKQEALSFFGNSAVYMERFLREPRHIEIQLVCDEHGNYFHVGERDCSVQRRHQKIIEESPSPGMTQEQRDYLGNVSINLAREVGYTSVGTVEFLSEGGNFYFMEVNTRIQVEHPVTETVASIDLIKAQIKIACGETISIPNPLTPRGHCIECRINAEDPVRMAPWPGKITEYHEPGGPGVRVDSMVYSGYTVPSHYDSMIAKLITSGKDREEARIRMIRALTEMKLDGIRTNIPLHLKIMNDPDFINGCVSTHFMERFMKT